MIRKYDMYDRKNYDTQCKILKKLANDITSIVIDKKRQVSKQEKEEIWNESRSIKEFDQMYFRLDMLGNIVIKNIVYNNNSKSRVFSTEYEHIISYSNGGRTDKDNIGLLNAGINRSKRSTECFKLNFNEINGLCSIYGMKPDDLLYKLDNNLHKTCDLYDIYFTIYNGKYTIKNCKYDNSYKEIVQIDKHNLNNTNNVHSQIYRMEHQLGYDRNKEINNRLACMALGVAAVAVVSTNKLITYKKDPQETEQRELRYPIPPQQETEEQQDPQDGEIINSVIHAVLFIGGTLMIILSMFSKTQHNQRHYNT